MAFDRVREFLHRATSPAEVIYALEALVAAKKKGKLRRLQRLIREHAAETQKIELLSRWAFSEPYRVGGAPSPVIVRHVMYSNCAVDAGWLECDGTASAERLGCGTDPNVPCTCVRWLREHPEVTDRALNTLVRPSL